MAQTTLTTRPAVIWTAGGPALSMPLRVEQRFPVNRRLINLIKL